jgi:NADH-quinone oxidoreductase subunit E
MFEKKEASVYLTEDLLKYIDKWKNVRGSLIMILHRVQEEYGFVPREVAIQLSRKLNVPLAKIYGITTFYHFFKARKPGKYNIAVCMGTACYLKGGEDIMKELEVHLGIGVGGVTEDEMFSLEAVRCVGCCGLAPVLTINNEVFGRLKKKEVPEILSRFRTRA